MPVEWTPKQERKYEHIVQSERDSGESPRRAKEIAARTVNKERDERGQSKTASRSSVEDVSSSIEVASARIAPGRADGRKRSS